MQPLKQERFGLGRNWRRFLSSLNEDRICAGEESLVSMLQSASLEGKTFLDVSSGGGLFSLAAMRLGAARVHSFDFDPQRVACALELKKEYYPGTTRWIVEQGSALDQAYLSNLGTFEVVYAWGVLHHTGKMWQAIENTCGYVFLRVASL